MAAHHGGLEDENEFFVCVIICNVFRHVCSFFVTVCVFFVIWWTICNLFIFLVILVQLS